jgi:hypothetical protein
MARYCILALFLCIHLIYSSQTTEDTEYDSDEDLFPALHKDEIMYNIGFLSKLHLVLDALQERVIMMRTDLMGEVGMTALPEVYRNLSLYMETIGDGSSNSNIHQKILQDSISLLSAEDDKKDEN